MLRFLCFVLTQFNDDYSEDNVNSACATGTKSRDNPDWRCWPNANPLGVGRWFSDHRQRYPRCVRPSSVVPFGGGQTSHERNEA